jgi:hypothetical protein
MDERRLKLLRPLQHVLANAALASATGCGLISSQLAELHESDASAARVLADLVASVVGSLELSGERIAAQTDELATARLSVHYRMRLIQSARATLGYRDPHVGLLDLWALCRQLEAYLTTGEGSELFGELQPLAIEAARQCEQRVAEQAHSLFDDVDLESAAHDIAYTFADEHPIRDGFARIGLQEADFQVEGEGARAKLLNALSLDWINPLSGFGSDITEGAEAVGAAMDRFTSAAESLPMQLGWQLKLFLYDFADTKPINQVAQGVQQAAASVDQLVTVADGLPQRLREALTSTFRDVESTLVAAKQTLSQARAAANPIEEVGAQWGTAASQVDEMAEELTTTLAQFEGTYRMLTDEGDQDGDASETAAEEPPTRSPDGDPSRRGDGSDEGERPFHILDWDRTAQSIDAMCEELQRTMGELRQTLGAPQVEGALDRAHRVAQGTVATAALAFTAGGAALIVLAAFAAWLLRRLRRHA